MKTLTTLIAVASIAASGITIADADTALESRSVTVRFADLDTNNVYGAAALYQRIAGAAATVCRDLEPGRQLAMIQPYSKCLHKAIDDAVAKVGRPAVTAYAVAHGARPSDAAVKIARNQ